MTLSTVIWAVQWVLAVFFLVVGAAHAFRSLEKLRKETYWVGALNPGVVRLIGGLEMLGAVGLIGPAMSGVMPWLTTWAALGLGLTMLGAVVFHLSRREFDALPINLIPLAMAALVVVGSRP